MKKELLIVCICIILLMGCSKEKNNPSNVLNNKNQNEKLEQKKENQYIDNNPIKLALYNDKKKITNFKSPMTIYTDIVSLECYYTNDDNIIDGKFKEVFNHYYNNYQNIDNYKIGYYIKFNTTDGEISKYIYSPIDTESFFNYIQTYLYDDIHQNDGYYDHISKEEYNDSTLLTSIKLTASKYIDRVNSNIEIKAFSYLKKDINENNEYIGNSKYSVLISKSM